MPLLPVHQCGQVQFSPWWEDLQELVIFHQGCAATACAPVQPCGGDVTSYDVTLHWPKIWIIHRSTSVLFWLQADSLPSPTMQNVTTWRVLWCCEITAKLWRKDPRYQDLPLDVVLDNQDQGADHHQTKPGALLVEYSLNLNSGGGNLSSGFRWSSTKEDIFSSWILLHALRWLLAW